MQVSCLPPSRNNDHHHRDRVRAFVVLACYLFAASVIAAPAPAVPDFGAVAQSVDNYFASVPGYRAGDLISRSQIEGALRSVEAVGWKVPNASDVAALGLADNSFLIRELSSPAGRKFMRMIARQPGAYARLDRLSTISQGQKIVHDLIRQPGGDELITYLASTKGGENLGKSLSAARNGVDLNKPTGRIYTADDLIAALKHVHESAAP